MASEGAPSGRRSSGLAANLALALASLLMGLAALEATARLLSPLVLQPAAARLRGDRGHLLLDAYPSNPRGYFDLDLRSPEVRARFPSVPRSRLEPVARRCPWAVVTRYNSLGFRDSEPGPRPSGVRRVVVVGDSFTEGEGVKATDTLAAQLQARLDGLQPGRWEVRNAGRRGADFPALNAVFRAALDAYAPDVVVYAWVLNDVERSDAFEARHPYVNDWIMLRMGGPRQRSVWEPRLWFLVRNRIETARLGRASILWYQEMYGPNNSAGWSRTRDDVVALRDEVSRRGGYLLVAIWPLLVDLDEDYPFTEQHATIETFLRTAGIPSVDLLEALRGRDATALWVHPVDHHPNEIAQGLAAEALAPTIARLE